MAKVKRPSDKKTVRQIQDVQELRRFKTDSSTFLKGPSQGVLRAADRLGVSLEAFPLRSTPSPRFDGEGQGTDSQRRIRRNG